MLQPLQDLAILPSILQLMTSFFKDFKNWTPSYRKEKHPMSYSLQVLQVCLSKLEYEDLLKEAVLKSVEGCLKLADMDFNNKRIPLFATFLIGCLMSLFFGLFVLYVEWKIALVLNPTIIQDNNRIFGEDILTFTANLPLATNHIRSEDSRTSEDSSGEELSSVESLSVDNSTTNKICNEDGDGDTSDLGSSILSKCFEFTEIPVQDYVQNPIESSATDSGFLMNSGESTKINSIESDPEFGNLFKNPFEESTPRCFTTNIDATTGVLKDVTSSTSREDPGPVPLKAPKVAFEITTEEGRAALHLYLKGKMASLAKASSINA